MHQIQPAVGQWYMRRETGQRFEVIDIDDGDGMIEIQDEEGTLDQIDSDTWFEESLIASNHPRDVSAAFDNLSPPDEADGGDATEPAVIDDEPLRVSSETSDADEDVLR